jgi:hypothetical protein
MKCEVCNKEAMENKVICSEHCGKIRKMIFELKNKYFPTHGCDNCWGDLHQGCTEQCKKEFVESSAFYKDLWKLVNLNKNKR